MAIISTILSPFDIFVSTFYSTRDALGATHKMPVVEIYCEQLTYEQGKILGALDIGSKQKELFSHNNKGSKLYKK